MKTNFSLKPGAMKSTRLLLQLFMEKDWTMQELIEETKQCRKSIYSNLFYYQKIGLIQRSGIKPNYIYQLIK